MVYIPYKVIPIGLAIFAVIAQYIRVRLYMDYDRVVLNHAPGRCHIVAGIEHGSEDMASLEDGRVLITSGAVDYSHRHLPCFENVKGGVFVFDMNNPHKAAALVEVKGFSTKGFNPLGISVWKHEQRTNFYTVMITNPQQDGDTVEQFTLDAEQSQMVFNHVKTVKDPEFGRLHGVACINENDFYVTNSWYSNSRLGLLLEQYFWLKWGLVQLYENNKSRIVVRDLFFASGIEISSDGKFVYVTESLPGTFRIYKRKSNNRLVKNEIYKVKSNPNNIGLTQNSNEVFLGSHPASWSMLAHSVDIHKPTPAHVIRLTVEDGHVQSMTEVYSDDGHRLWGSSSAYRHRAAAGKDGLLIGTIHHKMAYCYIERAFRN